MPRKTKLFERAQAGLLACVLGVTMLGSSGCVPQDSAADIEVGGAEKPLVISTVFASYDFARQIGAETLDLRMLVSPGTEPHSFEPTPQDMIDLSNCDLFIYAGGESDAWVEKLLASLDNPDLKVLRLIDCVPVLEEDPDVLVGDAPAHGHHHDADEAEHTEAVHDEAAHEDATHDEAAHDAADEHDEAAHDDATHDEATEHEVAVEHDEAVHEEEHAEAGADAHAGELDEHVWTSLRNAQAITQAIADVLQDIDAPNRSLYQQNTAAYIVELQDLDAEISNIVKSGQRDLLVFGDRFPFRYFADDYDLECRAAFSGCSTATEASARTVAALVDIIQNEDLPVVLHQELSDHRIASAIARETGVQSLQLQSAHNVSSNDFAAGISYVSLMRENAEVLRQALN